MQLKDFDTLAEAKAYTQRTLKPVDERMLNERGIFSLIGLQDGEALMQAIEATPNIPDRVKAWFKPSEQGIDIADPNALTILAGMVQSNVLTQANSDILTEFAYTTTQPYQNATEADWQRAKKTINYVQISDADIESGYIKITVNTSLNADFEAHRPQIYIEAHGQKQRKAGFELVSESGTYTAFVGSFRGLFVDDAYGAITNG